MKTEHNKLIGFASSQLNISKSTGYM